MADKKISQLTELTSPASADYIEIIDASETSDTDKNKRITLENLKSELGDVVGPSSSTDNAVVRFDSTTGKLLQNSAVTIDDSGSINIPSGQAYKINGTALAYTDITNAISLTEAQAIKLDDFATPDDNTDLDATTSYHGLLPKLGGGTTNFLRADGTWQNPNAQAVEDSDFTAKGDLVSASAASTTSMVSVGTDGQVLTADSGETAGLKYDDMMDKLGISYTNVNVNNTTTETTLFTYSVPANSLGSSGGLAGRIYVSTFDVLTAATCTLRLKYGSTTVCSVATPGPSGNLASLIGYIDFALYATGSTGSQEGQLYFDFTEAGHSTSHDVLVGRDAGTSSEDSTGALNLVFTVQWSGASASNRIIMASAHSYLIK